MCQEKQRHGGVKQCIAEAKQRKVTLCMAKEWKSSARNGKAVHRNARAQFSGAWWSGAKQRFCKAMLCEARACSVAKINGIEMNRSAMDWHGAAQQRL